MPGVPFKWLYMLSFKAQELKVSLHHVLSQKNYIGLVTGIWGQIGENQSAKAAFPGMPKTKGAGVRFYPVFIWLLFPFGQGRFIYNGKEKFFN